MPAKPHPTRCPTCRKIRAAHKAGITGRNDIAKKVGCALATVTAHAKHCGISFDRTATKAAVAARQIDLRARRQAIVQRLYGRSEHVLDRLEADTYRYTIAIPGQGFEHVDDSEPPAQDERHLGSAIAGYLTAAAKLEQIDGDSTVSKAASTITLIANAFGLNDAG